MKKSINFILFIVCCNAGKVLADVQFPLKLAVGGKHGVEYHRPVSKVENSETTSAVIVKLDPFINGYPMRMPTRSDKVPKGSEGTVEFSPQIHVADVESCLEKARLTDVKEIDGYYTAHYTMPPPIGDRGDDTKDLVVSTKKSGRIYQCPLPHMITIEKHSKTPFTMLQSEPVCHGLSIQECKKKQKTVYAHKNNIHQLGSDKTQVVVAPLGDSEVSLTYNHTSSGSSTTTQIPPEYVKYLTHGALSSEGRPVVMTDDTAKVGQIPLKWNVLTDNKGNAGILAYKYQAQIGDLNSKSLSFSHSVDPVMKVFPAHHIGFQKQHNEVLKDDSGKILIPSLYATKFIQGDDKHIQMHCMYGEPSEPENALVMATSLGVTAENCRLYGKDAVTEKEYKGTPLNYFVNKDIMVMSKARNGATPGVAVHVMPSRVSP